MSNKSDLKVRMEFTAKVFVGGELFGQSEQIMGFPDMLDKGDLEQVHVSLGEGQPLAGKLADQCANVAVWRAAHEMGIRYNKQQRLADEQYEKDNPPEEGDGVPVGVIEHGEN